MGPAVIPIMIAMTVASAAMTAMQARQQANDAAKQATAEAKAANKNVDTQYAEVDRQQRDVNKIAEEQRSDRMRQARQELGSMRVIAGERGASASTFDALQGEVSYAAGLDLSRIESNRKDNIEAGQAAKLAARQGGINTINIAKNQASVAAKGAEWTMIGAGIQMIGSAAKAGAANAE